MRPLRADIFTTEHAPKRWPLYGPHYYDELAAEIENGPIVCHIWANHWYRIVDRGLRIGVLEAAEDGGLIGVSFSRLTVLPEGCSNRETERRCRRLMGQTVHHLRETITNSAWKRFAARFSCHQ